MIVKKLFDKMKVWHSGKSKQTAFRKYDVKLQRKGENYAGYNICGITANSSIEAIEHAKRFVAENGWWPIHTNINERMESLSCAEIKVYTEVSYDGN